MKLAPVLIAGLVACGPTAAPRSPLHLSDVEVTHIVDSGGTHSWTPQGFITAVAYLRGADELHEGRVECDLRRFLAGVAEADVWQQLTGSLANAYENIGPSGPTLAVPLRLDGPLEGGVWVVAECRVVTDDAVSAVRSHQPHLYPSVGPDLAVAGVSDIYECESHAAPVEGRAVCIDVQHGENDGLQHSDALAMHASVACEVRQGRRSVFDVRVDRSIDELHYGTVALSLPTIPAGEYDVRCRTDATERVPERDESNNQAVAVFRVAAERDDSRYRARIIEVGPEVEWQVHGRRRGTENGPAGPPTVSASVAVELENEGPYKIHEARIECSGDGASFTGTMTLEAGARGRASLGTENGQPSPGRYPLSCRVRVTDPRLPGLPVTTETAFVTVPPPPSLPVPRTLRIR
ncbi:MAG: hypothetical protein AAF645_23475 [Myxococcota bacterium]